MEGVPNQHEIHALEVRNLIQVLCAERAGKDLAGWIEQNAKEVGAVIDTHPEVVVLFDNSPEEALRFIEEALKESEQGDITH